MNMNVMTMTNSQPRKSMAVAPRATAEAKPAVTDMSGMIEAALFELVPSLDKSTVTKLSRQLAPVLLAYQSSSGGKGKESIKLQLKRLSRRLLAVAERRRRQQQQQQSPPKPSPVDEKKTEAPKDEPASKPFDAHLAKADRHHVLINVVGESLYDEIVSTSEEIKRIRRESAVWTNFSQQAPLPDEEERAPASEMLPRPISDVYFRIRLVDAMRVVDARICASPDEGDGPDPCQCIVRDMDWEALLEDAKTKLAAYRQFERENVKEGEEPSFSCSSGQCFLS